MPDEGTTTVVDVIRGETEFENALQDDLVIARADGTPVYHLAVVVDDHDAGITHVVRGADHYSNTPKHVLIQQAMGAGTPVYAHLPLLHGPDGKKLSKRHGAASVQELRDRGYLPEAVRNYLALLGWGYDEETTFFTTEELQRHFSLEQVSKSPAVFDEQKLRWMNGRYLRELALDDLTARLEALTGRTGLRDAVAITQEKISTLDEFWPLARAFFDEPVDDAGGAREVPRARSWARRRSRVARAALVRRAGAVDARGGRGGAARGRRALRDEGQAGLPAAARRAHRHDDLAGHLRDGRADRARQRPWRGSTPRSTAAAAPDRPPIRGWHGSTVRPRLPIGVEGRLPC